MARGRVPAAAAGILTVSEDINQRNEASAEGAPGGIDPAQALTGGEGDPLFLGVPAGGFFNRPYRPGSRALTNDEAFDRLASGVAFVVRHYVRTVDAVNRAVGLVAMYGLFVMMGILSYAVFTNVVLNSPAKWVMEMAQFTMAAYYLLGGGFTLQQGAHVRMDVLYERWGPRTRAIVDAITDVVVIFYLAVVLSGGVSSTLYAIEYNQKNYSAWAPPMAPIKIIMTCGVLLMFAQAVAFFFRDIAAAVKGGGRPA